MERLKTIFRIFSFLDDFRWQKKENYNLINYFKDLDNDSRLLTHWLCYISDRQMPFEIIWDVGGFVFSKIVNEIKLKKDLSVLKPLTEETFVYKDNKGMYYFLSKSKANNLIINKYENYINENKVKFKPRFFPSDYLCILSTFSILKEYNYSITEYISNIYNINKNENDIIIRILFSLYLLTYYDIGQPNTEDLSIYENIINKIELRKCFVLEIIKNKNTFDNLLQIFKKDKIFNQKRAWCSLRDFIKSSEFHPYFRNAMLEFITEEDIEKLKSIKCLEQFVLPGDVWNNNSIFCKCILKNTFYENSKKSLNKILDEYYRNNKPNIGYPEQFDVTFDFVPRMCEKNNCDICPIKNIDSNNDIEKICINNKEKYCTISISSCNYKGYCVGKENCKIFNNV